MPYLAYINYFSVKFLIFEINVHNFTLFSSSKKIFESNLSKKTSNSFRHKVRYFQKRPYITDIPYRLTDYKHPFLLRQKWQIFKNTTENWEIMLSFKTEKFIGKKSEAEGFFAKDSFVKSWARPKVMNFYKTFLNELKTC